MRMLRLPILHSFGSLVSPAGTVATCRGLCFRLRAPVIRADTDDRPGTIVFSRHSLSGFSAPTDKTGSPRFPGELSCGYASVLRPRTTLGASPFAALPVLPPHLTRVNASSMRISGFNSGALPPAVYASRRALPCAMQHSLPADGLRLCRAGVEPASSR